MVLLFCVIGPDVSISWAAPLRSQAGVMCALRGLRTLSEHSGGCPPGPFADVCVARCLLNKMPVLMWSSFLCH